MTLSVFGVGLASLSIDFQRLLEFEVRLLLSRCVSHLLRLCSLTILLMSRISVWMSGLAGDVSLMLSLLMASLAASDGKLCLVKGILPCVINLLAALLTILLKAFTVFERLVGGPMFANFVLYGA